MKYLQLLVDNSAALLAWLTALFGLLVTLELITLSAEKIGAIVAFVGLSIGLLALVLTVAKRKVVSVVDSSGVIRNGAASTAPTGQPSAVAQDQTTGLLTPATPVSPDLL